MLSIEFYSHAELCCLYSPPSVLFPCVALIILLLLDEIITLTWMLLPSLQIRLEKSCQVLGIFSFMSCFHLKPFLLISFSLRKLGLKQWPGISRESIKARIIQQHDSKWGPGFTGQRQGVGGATEREGNSGTETILGVILFLKRDHTQSWVFEVRRKEDERLDEEAVGLACILLWFFLWKMEQVVSLVDFMCWEF